MTTHCVIVPYFNPCQRQHTVPSSHLCW